VITSFDGPYEFLSNFWPSQIRWQGVDYPTLEHAFQAAKTLDEAKRRWIAALPWPADAKAAGQRLELRPDWEAVKTGIMAELVALKFADPVLRARLQATGEQEIVEGNHWFDRVWGQCPLGVGENRLGLILAQTRAAGRASTRRPSQGSSEPLKSG